MPDQPMSHSHSVPMHTPWKEQSFSQAAHSREMLPSGSAWHMQGDEEGTRERERERTRTGEKLRACRKCTQFARELLVLSHQAHGGDQ